MLGEALRNSVGLPQGAVSRHCHLCPRDTLSVCSHTQDNFSDYNSMWHECAVSICAHAVLCVCVVCCAKCALWGELVYYRCTGCVCIPCMIYVRRVLYLIMYVWCVYRWYMMCSRCVHHVVCVHVIYDIWYVWCVVYIVMWCVCVCYSTYMWYVCDVCLQRVMCRGGSLRTLRGKCSLCGIKDSFVHDFWMASTFYLNTLWTLSGWSCASFSFTNGAEHLCLFCRETVSSHFQFFTHLQYWLLICYAVGLGGHWTSQVPGPVSYSHSRPRERELWVDVTIYSSGSHLLLFLPQAGGEQACDNEAVAPALWGVSVVLAYMK